MEELNESKSWIAGRYERRNKLGEGSTGIVWEVYDHVRRETIALRCLDESLIGDIGGFDEAVKYLRTTTHFRHPSVVSVFDFAFTDGLVYLSMELQHGRNLKSLLEDARGDENKNFDELFILNIIKAVVGVLQEGLATGYSHAGIKPENIWIRDQGHVSLSEYGLHNLLSNEALKSSAAILLTGQYLAPEMYTNDVSPNFLTDQFACGALWTELIQASHLQSEFKTFEKHRSVIQRLTETKPEHRFNRIEQLIESIKTIEESSLKGGRKVFSGKSFNPPRLSPMAPRFLGGAMLIIFTLVVYEIFSGKDNTIYPIIEISEIRRELKELDRDRINLIKVGFEHVELHTFLESQFTSYFPIDSILDLESSVGSNKKPHLVRLHNHIESENRRIKKTVEFVNVLSDSKDWIVSLEESLTNELPASTEWLQELSQSQKQSLDSLALGHIDDAIKKLSISIGEIRSQVNGEIKKEKQLAYEGRSRWKKILTRDHVPYGEPQEDLTFMLEGLKPIINHDKLQSTVQMLRHVQNTYKKWSNEWELLPEATTKSMRNSLGMVFVKVDNMMVSIWETRVIDFFHFVERTGFDENRSWREESLLTSPAHPVSTITRYGAIKFCEWLTEVERSAGLLAKDAYYSLPTDQEWSRFAGLESEVGDWPLDRHLNSPDLMPWIGGPNDYSNHGNYFTLSRANEENQFFGKKDRYHTTAPVGQFPSNQYGLFDVGGNVMEWVSTPYRKEVKRQKIPYYTLRGGGWRTINPEQMRVGFRINPPAGLVESGFRCVIKNMKQHEE